jgi:hypothetical protein
MKNYKANASVIYTDSEGNKIDTFVIFDTNPKTGMTHINHQNLLVSAGQLELHAKTVGDYHMPLADAFSFEIIKKLREKYALADSMKKPADSKLRSLPVLAKAS